MKKALIYDPYLDTLGGGERYVLSFARALKKQGYQVEIAWPNTEDLKKAQQRFGFKFDFKINSQAYYLFSSQSSLLQRFRFTRQYDLLFWVSDGSLPLLSARKNFVHFQVPFTSIPGHSLINQIKLAFIDKLIYNSAFTRRVIEKSLPSDKGVILYPPIDTRRFKPAKRKDNIILSVGRFDSPSHAKRQDVLIKAFKKMQTKQKTDYRLVLAGGLKGNDQIITKLKKLAGKSAVDFQVNLPFSDLLDLFSRARIFWHAAGYGVDEQKNPHQVEHFGMTTVEAMAAGLVPVVINKGGQKEIVIPEIGSLWDSTSELVDQTLAVINSDKNRRLFSKRARRRSHLFSLRSFEKQITSLLVE